MFDGLTSARTSYMPVGATFDHVHDLRKREGCLTFAGEATSAFDGQCVLGAYNTGIDAAVDVLTMLMYYQCEYCEGKRVRVRVRESGEEKMKIDVFSVCCHSR